MLMQNTLEVFILTKDGRRIPRKVSIRRVGCARHASRDGEAVRATLQRIREEGYQVHDAGTVCRKSRYLLTNEETIEVQGPQTSGEVEVVVIRSGGELLVSVGSDHNDRSLSELWTASLGKVFDSAKTKQMVPAVVAKDAWYYEEVKDHWDRLILRSFVTVSDKLIPYQEFALASLLDVEYHLKTTPWLNEDGGVLLGGTCGMLPSVPEHVFQFQRSMKGLFFPTDFHFEMEDPVLGRKITHAYTVVSLEEPGSVSA